MAARAKKRMDTGTRVRGRFRGRWLLGLGLAAAVGASMYWILNPLTLPLRSVELAGVVGKVDQVELRALLTEELDANFLRLSTAEVRARIEAHPWVERAVIRKRWPDRLVVNLIERQPQARWGDRELLDQTGVRYRASTAEYVHLPLIQGPDGEELAMMERFREVQERLSRLGLQVVALQQSERRSWQITLAGGLQLELGRQQFDRRLERFAQIWPRVLAPKHTTMRVVDLRYANGFAVSRLDRSQGEAS